MTTDGKSAIIGFVAPARGMAPEPMYHRVKSVRMSSQEILAEVKANHARLDGCAGPHDFSEDLCPDQQIGKKWRCGSCLGEVEETVKRWYERGLAHARRAL